MDKPYVMTTSHSHLFRGARLTSEAFPTDLTQESALELLVKFSDGSAAWARYSVMRTGPLLAVSSYQTSAGTVLDDKTWLLDYLDENQFKVLGQAP